MKSLVVALALAALTGCSGFRSLVLGWSNDDLVGAVAPPLEPGTWIQSQSQGDVPTARVLEHAPPTSRWRLVFFFLPH